MAVDLNAILNKYSAQKEVQVVPTGIYPVDDILGGGLVPGSLVVLWAPQGSFKSTLSLQIAKTYMKRGERVLFMDVERALNDNQAKTFGVKEYLDNGLLVHTTASTYAEADEQLMAIGQTKGHGDIKLIIIDSETMLLPKIAADLAVDSLQPGTKARQAVPFLTKLKGMLYDSGITGIVLAHARANMMDSNPYAPAHIMAGGYAMKHVPDAIVALSPGSKIVDEENTQIGVTIHVNTEKNKFAPPFRKTDIKCYYGIGWRKSIDLIDRCLSSGIIQQNGAYFTFPDANGEEVKIRGAANIYKLTDEQLFTLQKIYEEQFRAKPEEEEI